MSEQPAADRHVFSTIEEAIEDLRQGRMLIILDDEERENEGDIVCAAEFATPETVNFMATPRTRFDLHADGGRAAGRARDSADGRAEHRASPDGVLYLGRCKGRHDDRYLGGRSSEDDSSRRRSRRPVPKISPVRVTSFRCAPIREVCSSGPGTPRPRSICAGWAGCSRRRRYLRDHERGRKRWPAPSNCTRSLGSTA